MQVPRMNAIIERWVRTCRRELLDRTLIWNQRHLLHTLREYEQFYNLHRPHRGIANARLQRLKRPRAPPTARPKLTESWPRRAKIIVKKATSQNVVLSVRCGRLSSDIGRSSDLQFRAGTR